MKFKLGNGIVIFSVTINVFLTAFIVFQNLNSASVLSSISESSSNVEYITGEFSETKSLLGLGSNYAEKNVAKSLIEIKNELDNLYVIKRKLDDYEIMLMNINLNCSIIK